MHPVQHFRANFAQDEVVDTASDKATGHAVGNTELHEIDSTVRNLCFIWEDGRKAFFNYADLILTDRLNVLLLYFSGQLVTLKGYQLGLLFDLLLNHVPKTIMTSNPRYYMEGNFTTALVIDIIVRSD